MGVFEKKPFAARHARGRQGGGRARRAHGRRRRRLGGGGQRGGRRRPDHAHLDRRRRVARVPRGQDAAGLAALESRRGRWTRTATVHLRQLEAAQDRSPSRSSWRPRCKNARRRRCATSRWRWRRCSRRCTRSPSGSRDRPVGAGGAGLLLGGPGRLHRRGLGAARSDVGCKYVIVGHSERRQLFGETDAAVNLKVRAALRDGLDPIVCVGETLAERDAGETLRPSSARSSTAALAELTRRRAARAGRSPTSRSGPSAPAARRRPRRRKRCMHSFAGELARTLRRRRPARCASSTAAASSRTTPRR